MRHICVRLKRPLSAMAIALSTLVAGLAPGCGSSHSQAAARDAVTDASCDFYARCSQIGPGKTYETRDSCEVQVRASWDNAWPVETCDGKINSDQLNICLNAIGATECANALDVLNTLLNKCPQDKVCSGP